jgi:hypothetical protein
VHGPRFALKYARDTRTTSRSCFYLSLGGAVDPGDAEQPQQLLALVIDLRANTLRLPLLLAFLALQDRISDTSILIQNALLT